MEVAAVEGDRVPWDPLAVHPAVKVHSEGAVAAAGPAAWVAQGEARVVKAHSVDGVAAVDGAVLPEDLEARVDHPPAHPVAGAKDQKDCMA